MNPRIGALGLMLWAALLCAGAGCGPRPPAEAAPSAQAAKHGAVPVYRLRVGDELEVRFLTDSTLTSRTPVTPGGTITLPMGGEVPAAGKTVGELSRDIESLMSAYLLDPAVAIVVTGLANQPVFVIGEVQRPGRIDSLGELTVSRAVASAGGLLATAKAGSVMVVRTVGVAEPAAYRIDLADVLAGRDLAADITLLPNDVVYVPKSVIGKVDEFVTLFFEEIIPVQQFFLYGYNLLHTKDQVWWP